MMQLLTQLSMMAAEADESTEDRVERLENAAEDSGVDENTLFDFEEEIRRYAKYRLESLEGEQREKLDQLKQQAPAMLGVPTEDVDDVVAVILGRMLVAEPERIASIVAGMNAALERSGLFDEVDVDPPAPEELPESIDLDVGALEGGQTQPGIAGEGANEFVDEDSW